MSPRRNALQTARFSGAVSRTANVRGRVRSVRTPVVYGRELLQKGTEMHPIRQTSTLLCALLAMSLLSPLGLAQNMATISGTVLDQSGATVAGASVKIEDQVKNVLVREARTDARGRFEALYLQPGVYTVRVEAAGFKTLSRAGVTLDVNTKVFDDNFQLEVGGVTETVSVTSDIPLVQTSTSEKSFLVEQKQIADLPINGRYFNALVATLPGVTDNGQSNFNIQNGTYLSNLHIAGGRGSQNQVYLDGQPNLTGGDSSAVFVA